MNFQSPFPSHLAPLIFLSHHLCVPYGKFLSLLEGIRINKIKHFQSSLINVSFDSAGGLNNSAEECSSVSLLRELPAGCTRRRVRPGRAHGARLGQAVAGVLRGFSAQAAWKVKGRCLLFLRWLRGFLFFFFFFLIDFHMMVFADHKCHSPASCSLWPCALMSPTPLEVGLGCCCSPRRLVVLQGRVCSGLGGWAPPLQLPGPR